MEGNRAGAPKSRMFMYRYMTFDEIAQALRTTPDLAKTLVSRKGWRLHEDTLGRPRASVPEADLHAWAASRDAARRESQARYA